MLELSEKEFSEKVLASQLPVLVDFWAPWCGPCKRFAPTIEKLAEEYDGKIKVYKANVDKNEALAKEYKIMSIPTVMLFKDGKQVDARTGAVPKDQLAAMIEKYTGAES